MLNKANVKLQDQPELVWQAINWQRANKLVNQLRQRIYSATAAGDIKRVRNLQRLLIHSTANKLKAIRSVTQLNQGRNTPGIDRVIASNDKQRYALYQQLCHYKTNQVKPVKRVYIPKSRGQHRPLGLPTIIDRCQQSVVKSALEPYWEAQFEGSSYGFRPGRSAHDAIQKVFCIARTRNTRKWVLDADIKGAFDHIDHRYLLERIGNFPARRWIESWLKAGVMTQGQLEATPQGTPQGGIVSPLLLNIALHGLEKEMGVEHDSYGRISKQSAYALVRYADDLVIFGRSQASLEEAKSKLAGHLGKRGLELSEHKTQICHLQEGFDYLGFHIKHYENLHRRTGKVLLIKPSKESVRDFRAMMKAEWDKVLGIDVGDAIKHLNQKIRGWGQYYCHSASKRTLSAMDHWMWKRQTRYCYRRHPNKLWWWKRKKYWGSIPGRRDKWVFMDKTTGSYLWKLGWFPIRRHVLVKGGNSTDDPALKTYWWKRQSQKRRYAFGVRSRLWSRQQGVCPVCKAPIDNGEEIHLHHKQARSEGGENRLDNLWMLHKTCHKQIHSNYGKAAELLRTA